MSLVLSTEVSRALSGHSSSNASAALTQSPDLHPGNVVFALQKLAGQPASAIMQVLGKPVRSYANEVPRGMFASQLPKYVVESALLPRPARASETSTIKLIDFGSSFFSGQLCPKMRCPLPFRAPEAVLTKRWDKEADIWSLGCTVSSLPSIYAPVLMTADLYLTRSSL